MIIVFLSDPNKVLIEWKQWLEKRHAGHIVKEIDWIAGHFCYEDREKKRNVEILPIGYLCVSYLKILTEFKIQVQNEEADTVWYVKER